MRLHTLFCGLLAAGTLVLAPSSSAERIAGGRPPTADRPVVQGALTMDQAVQTALRESPIVRGAVAEVEAAVGQLGVARSNTRPIVSANAFAGGGSLGNLFTTTAPVMPQMIQTVGPGGYFDQNFTLMYPLYTGGRLRALVRQAEAARRAQGADLEAVRLEVATMTRIAYRQAQYQQALSQVYEALTTTHRERLRVTQAAFEAGKVPQFYVPRDEAEVANAEQQLTNARRDAEQAMVQLKTWMGVSLSSTPELTEPARFEPVSAILARMGVSPPSGAMAPTPGVPPPATHPAPLQGATAPEGQQTLAGGKTPGGRTAAGGETPESPAGRRDNIPGGSQSEPPENPAPAEALTRLLQLAEQQRPELVAARERLAGGREGTHAARSLYQPQVSLGAMGDFMQMRDRDFLGGTTFGLVASLPVLDGGLRRSQVRAARAEQERLEQETAKVALQIDQEVTNAWLALQAAAQNVRTAEAGLRSAQEDHRVTQVRYEAGKGINLELLDAVAARTRAETNRAQALYEYGVAQDQLLRAIGRGPTAEDPTPAPGKAQP
jgi:outer membrane protein TolC